MNGRMKKRTMQGVGVFMALVLLAGCSGGGDAIVTGGRTGGQAPVVETGQEAGPRVMLSGNGKTLCGSTDQLIAGEFDAVTITRTDDTEEGTTSASMGFSLEKTLGEEGVLTVSGSLKMVPDASYLFDIPVFDEAEIILLDEDTEDGEENLSAGEDTEGGEENLPADENTEGGEDSLLEEVSEEGDESEDAVPDRVILSPEEGAALLEEVMNALISGTEPGASLQTESTENLTWRYGAAKALEGENGSSILNFCASAEAEGVLLYLNADAAMRGAKDAAQELEKVQEGLAEWMKSLSFTSAQGNFLGGNDCLKLSFAGKTLYTPGTDYLRASGAELSVSCGESYLNASYDGFIEAEGKEAFFQASLKSKHALTEEELAELEGLQGETLKGKNLDWTVSVTQEEDGSTTLLATTEADGAPLYFLAAADGFGENKEEACENVINGARGWLAALEMQ